MKYSLTRTALIWSSCAMLSCAGNSDTTPAMDNLVKLTNIAGSHWIQLTPQAAFNKSYNFQLITLRDTVWAFHPDGNYFSSDGKEWTMGKLSNIINNLAFLDYIAFKGAIYGLGHFEGNIERFAQTSTIYKTTNMRDWEVLAGESNLPKRFFYHPFVFNDRIWIIGGSDGKTDFADIWSSPDAVHWTRHADNLPFGKRMYSQVVNFKGKLYLLNSDVWSSTDGINWKLETAAIDPKENVFGYSPVVFDDKIWLIGCNRDGKFKSEVMISEDGKTWKAERAPWTPRGGMTATVFKGMIIATGGKYGGLKEDNHTTEFVYSNDVWAWEKK